MSRLIKALDNRFHVKFMQLEIGLLLTPLQLIARMNVSLKNYSCKLFNLTGTVGNVELISTFTTAVCESWNVSDKYTWDNAGDLLKATIYGPD